MEDEAFGGGESDDDDVEAHETKSDHEAEEEREPELTQADVAPLESALEAARAVKASVQLMAAAEAAIKMLKATAAL